MKPFVKWAGGKNQLLPILEKHIPKNINTYYEPFVGGGALFFHIKPKNAVINDSNKELMITYNTLKNDYNSIINFLKKHKQNNSKEYFYKIREIDRNNNWMNNVQDEAIASRFIFLNKNGFNGLYRVNSKNQYNVPYAGNEKTGIYDEENLRKIHHYLKKNKIKILNTDFTKAVSNAKSGDFIYFDPPYDKWDDSTFTKYQKNDFNRDNQIQLKKLCDELNKKGVKWMISNHNTDFIKNLWSDYHQYVVLASRMINRNANGRGKVEEIIIKNYEEPLKMKYLKEKDDCETFLNNITESIKNYAYWNDFSKIWENKDKKINRPEYIKMCKYFGYVNKDEFIEKLKHKDFKWKRYIPILFSSRDIEYTIIDTNGEEVYWNFDNLTGAQIVELLEKVGFFKIFKDGNIDIFSYNSGIEMGLDTNARKNRGGKLMEKLCFEYLTKYNSIEETQIITQAKIDVILKKLLNREFIFDLPLEKLIPIDGGKKLDIAFLKNNTLYIAELNYYSAGGSKSEVNNNYLIIQKDVEILKEHGINIEFILITDGPGWRKQKSGFKNIHRKIKNIYNLKNLKNGIFI